jgi:hypothetical protein
VVCYSDEPAIIIEIVVAIQPVVIVVAEEQQATARCSLFTDAAPPFQLTCQGCIS